LDRGRQPARRKNKYVFDIPSLSSYTKRCPILAKPSGDSASTYGFREMIFRKIQMFPRTFHENPLQSCKMSRMRLAIRSFWRRKTLSFGALSKLFRSAFQLPFKSLRFTNLNAPAPATTPYRNKFWYRAPLLLLVPAVLLVTFFVLRHSNSRETDVASAPGSSLQTNWQSAIDIATSAPQSRRAVFPYSVIPGGVRDAKELSTVAAKDPVVAEHYSGFQIARARTLRLDRPAMMYVSYRLNSRVYWTRNRMTIPAGETLLSDGENFARVRCGNRLSPVAALPVSLSEPSAERLESPDFVPPLLADLSPREGFAIDPLLAKLPAFVPQPGSGPIASGVPPVGVPPVGFPPILPPGVTPPGGTTVTPPVNPPPPVSTPEPGSLTLLLTGAFIFAAFWLFLRK